MWGDVAHGRLALLLLDNAAEMSLVHTAEASLIWAEINKMAYQLPGVEPNDERGQGLKAENEGRTISRRRKKQIERNYDALVDYVVENEDFALAI